MREARRKEKHWLPWILARERRGIRKPEASRSLSPSLSLPDYRRNVFAIRARCRASVGLIYSDFYGWWRIGDTATPFNATVYPLFSV